MALIRLNEQHGTALHRRDCRKCREETIHNARGCIHCGTAPKPVRSVPAGAYRYGRMPAVPKAAPSAPRRRERVERPSVPLGMRLCSGCNQALPLDAFGASSRYPGGLQHQCKPCVNAGERRRYAARKVRA